MKSKLIILLLGCGMFATFLPNSALAAKFLFDPENGVRSTGSTFSVDLKIDPEGRAINSAEGLIRFPADMLELVDLKTNGSAFTLWIKEPQFSKEMNGIYFAANSQNALLDSKLQVLRLEFKVKSTGSATLGALEYRILAHDGLGTDISRAGKNAVYQLVADNISPLPFDVSIDVEKSDNPVREISYQTSDSLSGIEKYIILIDGKEFIHTTSIKTILPPQKPGMHDITVRALDFGGNSADGTKSFEVLPLPVPTLNLHTKIVPYGEFGFITGKAVSGAYVDVHVSDPSKRELFHDTADVSASGDWELTINDILPRGDYSIVAIARDSRGAVSYPTEPTIFRVQEKPLLVVGFVSLGWSEIFIILIALGIFLAGFIWRYLVSKATLRRSYKTVIARDTENLLNMLHNNTDSLKKLSESGDYLVSSERDYLIEKIMTNIAKMKKYIVQGMEKIP